MANTLKFGNGQWATGNGTALAYNDENSNFKPLPFDFTRASSGTTVNQSGLIETVGSGLPRIDFQGNTKGALLLEPSRTNSISYSEDFSQSAWTKTNTSITSNSTISPDGNLNADSIVGNGASGLHYILNSVTVSSGQNYTFSIFAKVGTNNFFQLNMGGAPFASSNYCNFNLSNGTIGSFGNTTSNRFIEKLGNNWYRIGFTATSLSSGSANFFPTLITSATSSFLETNTLDTSVQIYGAQLEVGSYATSYIPTSGSAVTRVVDSCQALSVPNVPSGYPFVINVEAYHTLNTNTGVFGFYSVTNQFYYYAIQLGSNNKIVAEARPQGITQNILSSNSTFTEGFHKIAVLYENETTVKIYINGQLEGTKNNCVNNSFNSGFSDYQIGVYRSNNSNPCSIKNLNIFNTALTDQELIALTT